MSDAEEHWMIHSMEDVIQHWIQGYSQNDKKLFSYEWFYDSSSKKVAIRIVFVGKQKSK
jgi:hypothetical protein